jgi:hypothetical protein
LPCQNEKLIKYTNTVLFKFTLTIQNNLIKKFQILMFLPAIIMAGYQPTAPKQKMEDFTGFHKVQFELENQLGEITMMVPNEMDSSQCRFASSCTEFEDRKWYQFYDSRGGKLVGAEFISEISDSSFFNIVVLKQHYIRYNKNKAKYSYSKRDSIIKDYCLNRFTFEGEPFTCRSIYENQNNAYFIINWSNWTENKLTLIEANFICNGEPMELIFYWNTNESKNRKNLLKILNSIQISNVRNEQPLTHSISPSNP